MDKFLKWLTDCGVDFSRLKIRYNGANDRDCIAAQDILKGDVVMKIP